MKTIRRPQCSILAAVLTVLTQIATLNPQPASAQTNCTTRPPGLVAWWPGDGFASDVVGTNHGALQGGAAYAPGKAGQAFSFSGSGGYVRLPDDFFPFPTSRPFTFQVWFKTSVGGVILGQQAGRANMPVDSYVPGLYVGTDGKLRAELFWNGSVNPITSSASVNNGVFHQAVVVYTGGSQLLYLDAMLVGTHTHSQINGASANSYQFGVGYTTGWPAGNDGWYAFSGLLDEAALFNRALSPTEIQALYAAGSAGICYTNVPAPIFVQQPQSQTGYLGGEVTFSGVAMGTPRPTYQWQYNGYPVTGATNNTLLLSNLTTAQAGSYALLASNLFGSVTSAPATLTVETCLLRPPGLLAWWPGDGFALDLVGTNHGTLQNSASYGPGRVGQAFNLDGASAYVDLGAWAPGTQWTLMAWVAASALPSGRRNIVGGLDDCRDWSIAMQDGEFAVVIRPPGGCSQTIGSWVSAVSNTWYHVVGTCDGSLARIYVNGQLRASSPVDAGYVGAAWGTRIGGESCCAGGNFPGLVDEVASFNRALTSSEIASTYQGGSAGMCFTNDPAPVFAHQPKSQTGYLLGSATLSAAAMGTPRPSYQWRFNGNPIPGATNASLTLTNLALSNAGNYQLSASNTFSRTESAPALLSVLTGVILNEDFEDGLLDPRISVSTVGGFNYWPGIKSISDFGSTKAFGFGRSTCGASCFDSYATRLTVSFTDPTYVSYIRFKEMELYGDWGSGGEVTVDGVQYASSDLGKQPYNSRQADTYFRVHHIPVNKVVRSIIFRVGDITTSSEIFVDDLQIINVPGQLTVPETFSAGWADWSSEGYIWDIGVPAAGPPLVGSSRAHSPTNCAATLLGGNYSADSSGRLISPLFTVPAVDADTRVTARFWQYYQYGTGDSGLVQISPFNGISWGDWTTLSLAATNGTSTNWQQVFVDLTSYQGQQVRLGFQHTANSDGSVGAGWYLDDLSLSSFVPTPLTLGLLTTNQFSANGQSQYYVIHVPPGGHLRLTLADLDHLGANELYIRRGALPSPGSYDYRFKINGGADQSVFAPDAGAGDWYVLVYNSSGPTPGEYTLIAQFTTGVMLDTLTPSTVGNSVPGTVTIEGAGFTPDATVALVKGGTSYPAFEVAVVSSSRILADFDFTLIPTNTYALRVTCGTNTAELPLSVVYGGEPKFWSKLTVPRSVGRHAPAEIIIEFANTGLVAMPAPLLVLTGTERPILNLMMSVGSSASLQQGFWTATMPQGWSSTVQFLASGKTAGILNPGESNRITIAYAGLQQPWSWAPSVRFDLGVLTTTNTSPVDWASIKPNMRPTSLTDQQWSALWQNFTNQAGATWGDYVRMLNNNAAYLRKLGLNVGDIRDLLAFEFAQADGLNVIRNLASATDAYTATPGLGLAFGRVFPQSISQRYTLGSLGRGWSHNWDFKLSQTAEGDVTITGPGGSRRLFQPDSRGGYFAQTGDHGTLTDLGSGRFSLREPRGLLRVFRSDGKLDYAEDLNANRITAVWSGDQLTRLNHSSGQSLQFTYAGSFLQSVTDPVGRTTTFTYTGEHLTAARYFDGSTVNYAYNSPTAAHALSQITYPDTTQEAFSYDAQGRLGNISESGGSAVNFAYPGYGAVNISDALNNRTKFYLDHHGLLSKVVNPQTNSLQFAYDGEFNLTSLTDPAGRVSAYDYDDSGNLVQMTDALGGATRFSYGGAYNRLAQLTDAKGNVTRYNHDAKGNLNAITYANNSVERWGYDAAGNPTTWTNRRTQGISYQFDSAGRLKAKLYPDGSRAIYGYDSRGNLTLASNYVGAITLAYDAADRLQRITYPGSRWLEYSYDAAGRRTSMTDQLGYRLSYLYDAAGRLERMTNSAGLQLVRYAYDSAGRLALKTLGNGVYTTYGYDVAGQLLTLTNAQPGGTPLSFFNYTYDSRGRRVAMATHYGRWTYGYDDLGQLTRAVLASTSTNVPSQDLTYVYDALGNRVRTIENGVTTAYAVNNMNQYSAVGGIQMNYDSDGSLTQKLAGATTVLAITNNFDNRVTGFASTNWQRRFDYDALGFPSVAVRDGVQMYQIHDPAGLGDLVGVYSASGTLLERQNHAFGTIATADGSGPAFLTFDGTGNASDATAADASMAGTQVVRPFGERIKSAAGTFSKLGISGEFGVMQEGDLMNMRARFYDRLLGRFTARDPIGLSGGDVNLYGYVSNDPASHLDPSGLSIWDLLQSYKRILDRRDDWLNGRISDAEWEQESQRLQKAHTDLGKKELEDWANDFLVKQPLMGIGNHLAGFGGEVLDGINDLADVAKTFLPGSPSKPGQQRIEFDPDLFNQFTKGVADSIGSGIGQTVDAQDPNELIGPGGYGTQNFVAAGSLLPYRINFENYSNATAPAQFVTVQNVLAANLDLADFELSSLGFGDRFFAIPPGSQHYERTETLTMNGFRFQVQIEAGLNLATRTVYATFKSINPTNGLPPPVEIGFLPPENGTGRGMGHVSYVIRPKASLATGTEIRNVATIVFDQQPAIATDWKDPHNAALGIDTNKQALVTIDGDLPTSGVTGPSGRATNTCFVVSWSGNDAGSGIANYDIYVSTNSGAWTLWLSNSVATSATFCGLNDRTYGFYSVAHDNTGQTQSRPAQADIVTSTQPNYPPFIEPQPGYFAVVGRQLAVTNRAYDPDMPIVFSLDSSAPAGAAISTNGVFTWTPSCPQGSTTNLIRVWATDHGTPRMSNAMVFSVIVYECVEASIGNTVLLAGTAGCVPINLLSTVALTNLSFNVVYPAERFGQFSLTVNTQQVGALPLQSLSNGVVRISFVLPANRALQGPTNVAQLCFTSSPTQHSAFVPLRVTEVEGRKPSGSIVANAYGLPGRVTVVGPEPLLEAERTPVGGRLLTLYGTPGANYLIESKTNINGFAWQPGWSVTLAGLSQTFTNVGLAPGGSYRPAEFYRAYQLPSPPRLEQVGGTNGNSALILHGNAGSSYVIEWRTNIAAGAWQFGWRVPLTNSTQAFVLNNAGGTTRFYRASEFLAQPPLLESWTHDRQAMTLLVYGKPGTGYFLQSSPRLASGAGWSDLMPFSLTNSFRFLEGIGTTNQAGFFRVRRP